LLKDAITRSAQKKESSGVPSLGPQEQEGEESSILSSGAVKRRKQNLKAYNRIVKDGRQVLNDLIQNPRRYNAPMTPLAVFKPVPKRRLSSLMITAEQSNKSAKTPLFSSDTHPSIEEAVNSIELPVVRKSLKRQKRKKANEDKENQVRRQEDTLDTTSFHPSVSLEEV
jgi:hypothetical protein